MMSANTIAGTVGIERDIRTARLQNAEHAPVSIATDRSRQMPTVTPGPTPRSRKWWASWFA